jgi:plasmid stability protein
MGDLLIRGLDPETKGKLLESARKSGRSMSDEAALRLKHSLVADVLPRQPAGQRLRAIVDGFALTESERAGITASRHESDREPPSFDAPR